MFIKPRLDYFRNGDIWLADKTIQLLEHYGIKLLAWEKAILYRWMAVELNDGIGSLLEHGQAPGNRVAHRLATGLIDWNKLVIDI